MKLIIFDNEIKLIIFDNEINNIFDEINNI
jgi:hypothetical protein